MVLVNRSVSMEIRKWALVGFQSKYVSQGLPLKGFCVSKYSGHYRLRLSVATSIEWIWYDQF